MELDGPMTRLEYRASLSLAAIYMLRMLGMFLILPVFAIMARDLRSIQQLFARLEGGAIYDEEIVDDAIPI
jgi:hypothetical protein